MSAFLPINPAYGQQQKRALLERLLQQHMQNAARYAGQSGQGDSAPVASVGATPFRSSHPFGGSGLVVQQPHPMANGLAAALGPGSMPRAGYNPAASIASYINPAGMGHSTALAPEGSGATMPTPVSNPAKPAAGPTPTSLSTALTMVPQISTSPTAAISNPIQASFLTPQFAGTPQANGAARANVFNPGTGFFIPRVTGGGVF